MKVEAMVVSLVGTVDATRDRLTDILPDEYEAITWEHMDEHYNLVACYMVVQDGKVLWSGYPDHYIIVLVEGEEDDCYRTVESVVFK